ncbi:unnamed protein product [Vicia faba]|uniref:Protein E6 n=1 Tax=Vicia faba TaxID=3906 RepID=A0AAV1BA44_VICFA|nr:unnamed protein product [Vicia faba]
MAPISKLLSFIFLTTLLFSLQIHARESQFFSKVTHVVNNNVNEREVPNPNNEGSLNKPDQQQQQQQPVFIPETENSYGLYGHESGLYPPSTTSNNVVPNTYQSYEKTSSSQDENKNAYNNYFTTNQMDSYSNNNKYPNEISGTKLTATSYNNNNNNNYDKYYYNNNKYASNDPSNTKFTEEAYNSMENQNNNKYYYNNNNNNNYNNGERQGMSDTRVMEGGKYFYDVNSEKYNPTLFNGDSSKGVVNSENWYNKKGYFGSNNNVNTYENNKNSMNGYQNQEEFESDQEEFEP